MSNTRNNSTRTILGVLAGAAIGTGVTYLIYSKNGKKIRKNVAKKATEYNEILKNQVNSGMETAQKRIASALSSSKDYIDTAATTVSEKLDTLSNNIQHRIDEAHDAVDHGAKVAKRKIKEAKNGATV